MTKNFIIVGAGHGGVQLASSLRSERWQSNIVLIGEENYLPYQRPPLSKAYLTEELSEEKLPIRSQDYYEKQQIQLKLNTLVSEINPKEKWLKTSKDEVIPYDKCCLATGTRARRLTALKGSDAKGIYYLRSKSDVDAINRELDKAKKIVIIGGGYIGLEVAASLTKRQKQVTIIEAEERILKRVTVPEMSNYFMQQHSQHGTKFFTNTLLSDFVVNDDNQVTGIKTKDGLRIETDMIIVGIGVEVNDELAKNATIEVANGIITNLYFQSSEESIYAIGDCSNFYSSLYDRNIRLESVPNAMDQAKVVAKHATNKAEPYNALPWFWSNQYDIKLQIAGLSQNYDQTIIKGDIENNRFGLYYLKNGVVIAGDFINSPREFMKAKKMILNKETIE